MITLCCDSPLPTFEALHSSLMESIQGQIPDFTIPALPGLRVPIYDGFSQLGLELSQLVQELQAYQISLTLFNIFKPLADFLGGALEDLLPKIPNTDLTLLDIIAGDPAPIYAAIQQALADGLTFPMIPSPLFGDLSIPALEAVATAKALLRGYPALLVAKIKELIELATGVLELPGLPEIPSIPTRDDIEALILELFPEAESMLDVLRGGVTLSALFAGLSFPPLPPLILPEPLIQGFSSLSIELEEAMSIMQANATSGCIAPIVDFCNDTLSALGFEFPKICISF